MAVRAFDRFFSLLPEVFDAIITHRFKVVNCPSLRANQGCCCKHPRRGMVGRMFFFAFFSLLQAVFEAPARLTLSKAFRVRATPPPTSATSCHYIPTRRV